MYALIAAREYGGAAFLIDTARTLPAIQRKWDKHVSAANDGYKCIGILTPQGLVNYHGQPNRSLRQEFITATMGLTREY